MKPLLLDYNIVVCLNRMLVWHPTSHMYINIPTHIHTYIHTCMHTSVIVFLSYQLMFGHQPKKEINIFSSMTFSCCEENLKHVSPFVFSSSHLLINFPFITNRGGVGPFVTARVWFCYSLPFSDPSSNYKPSDPKASAVRTHGVSIFSPGGALSRSNLTWCLQDH